MDGNPNLAHEMSPWQMRRARLYYAWLKFRRRYIPHLVWAGDEVDVVATFKEDRLRATTIAQVGYGLQRGILPDIKTKLNEIGIEFDSGLGLQGRDWEWDWSLQGPISVRFKSRATRPERRTA